jgi:hypothetical protein
MPPPGSNGLNLTEALETELLRIRGDLEALRQQIQRVETNMRYSTEPAVLVRSMMFPTSLVISRRTPRRRHQRAIRHRGLHGAAPTTMVPGRSLKLIRTRP